MAIKWILTNSRISTIQWLVPIHALLIQKWGGNLSYFFSRNIYWNSRDVLLLHVWWSENMQWLHLITRSRWMGFCHRWWFSWFFTFPQKIIYGWMGLVCMNLSTRQCRDKNSQRREGCARSFPATEIKMFQGPELSRLISLHQTVGDLSKTCPKSRCFGGMIIHQPKTFEQFYLLEASLSKVYSL